MPTQSTPLSLNCLAAPSPLKCLIDKACMPHAGFNVDESNHVIVSHVGWTATNNLLIRKATIISNHKF